MEKSRRQKILDRVSDAATNLVYYDRKEDETLGVGGIEEAIAAGEITVQEMIDEFARCVNYLREREPRP
jgi:hypothetical protein